MRRGAGRVSFLRGERCQGPDGLGAGCLERVLPRAEEGGQRWRHRSEEVAVSGVMTQALK